MRTLVGVLGGGRDGWPDEQAASVRAGRALDALTRWVLGDADYDTHPDEP